MPGPFYILHAFLSFSCPPDWECYEFLIRLFFPDTFPRNQKLLTTEASQISFSILFKQFRLDWTTNVHLRLKALTSSTKEINSPLSIRTNLHLKDRSRCCKNKTPKPFPNLKQCSTLLNNIENLVKWGSFQDSQVWRGVRYSDQAANSHSFHTMTWLEHWFFQLLWSRNKVLGEKGREWKPIEFPNPHLVPLRIPHYLWEVPKCDWFRPQRRKHNDRPGHPRLDRTHIKAAQRVTNDFCIQVCVSAAWISRVQWAGSVRRKARNNENVVAYFGHGSGNTNDHVEFKPQ